LQGFSGRYDDYLEHFLFPLGEEFRVVTYNHRGHSGSGGKFDAKRGTDDWKEIIENMGREPAYFIGHSYGANLATRLDSDKIKGIYCFEPLFDFKMINGVFQLGINALSIAKHIGFLELPDSLLDASGIPLKAGFNNTHPLQSFTELSGLKEQAYEKPLAFAFTDKDIVFGTNNSAKQKSLIKRIKARYHQAKDRSHLIAGLNHCLNLTPGDFAPFLKPEQGKDSKRIIEDIINFFSE